jgi:hypothetical protein
MGWNKREAVSNLVVLGDDEGQVKTAGGLLASLRQDTMYPTRHNYELVLKTGESVWLAGSASLGRQIGPTDVGHFVKVEFQGWGQGANGKYKIVGVQIYEGEPTDAMKAWPRYKELATGGAALKAVAAREDEPEPVDTGDDDLPF